MVALGEANKTHNEFQFDTKAVIVPLVSSTGHGHASMKRVKYQEGKFALGSILCAVIPKDENFVLAKYLHIYLHWNREELLVSQMKGMANVSLPMNKIADVLVTIPSIEKQKAIIGLEQKLVVKEFDADKLFADQLTQIENLSQAILQEAVQGKLVKQNNADEPAHELLKRIKAEKEKAGKKEKPLPSIKPEEIPFEIPENWVWCRLGDAVNAVSDVDHRMPEKKSTGIPYISPRDFYGINEIDFENAKKISDEEYNILSRKVKPEIYDIIFPRYGTIGVCRYLDYEKKFLPSYSCVTIKTNKVNTDPKFVFYYCICPFSKIEIDRHTVKTTQPNVGIKSILEFRFPLPPLSEQKRIVEEIEKQLAKTKQLKEHIIANQLATEQLLKALLHQAFEVEDMEEV